MDAAHAVIDRLLRAKAGRDRVQLELAEGRIPGGFGHGLIPPRLRVNRMTGGDQARPEPARETSICECLAL